MTSSVKPNVLYLDDERENLDGFYYSFFDSFDIQITTDPSDAIKILASSPIEVLIVDQKMPQITGIEFIKSIKPDYPDLVCIIITAYANLSDALEAVNEASIYRFLSKPWNRNVILNTVHEGVENYRLKVSNKSLLNELKERNAELESAYKKVQASDKLKSLFLKNLSHEIRTPLNGIMGFSELLLYRFNTECTEKAYAEFIYNSGERLLTVIEDIIIASLIQSSSIQQNHSNFYPQDLLYELSEKFRRRIEIAVPKVEFLLHPSAMVMAFSDKDKILKILQILLDNALKFTDKGKISIECKMGCSDTTSNLHLIVSDTGLGIEKKYIQQIFEPFSQIIENSITLASGTGLGLTICKAYVELLNGKIEVESQLDVGTTIEIVIPVEINKSVNLQD